MGNGDMHARLKITTLNEKSGQPRNSIGPNGWAIPSRTAAISKV
jgi:hypothetical protein